jgi:CRP-like cAMP-binding protein
MRLRANEKADGSRAVQSKPMKSKLISDRVLYKDLFAGLPAATVEAFRSIQLTSPYGPGAMLFAQNQMARGIFLIRTGSVRLSESPASTKNPRSRMAGPGEMLGIGATIAACPYRAAAKTNQFCEISFIERDDFTSFLRHHHTVAFRVVQSLSHGLYRTFNELRNALAQSPQVTLQCSAEP